MKKILVFGLGPIGMEVLQQVHEINPDLLIGAIDIDPEKVGMDIGLIVDREKLGININSNVENIDSITSHPIAIHATGSNLGQIWPQIKNLLDNGFSVVSTCEQLSFPFHRYSELSKEIDSYAKSKGLSVIGTGINPGFIMDTMAICFSTVFTHVHKVTVYRNVDVSKRRTPLQKKVGIGMSVSEFEELARNNQIGHVGLEESLRLTAYGLNWELESVKNSINPKIIESASSTSLKGLAPGEVSGQRQVSYGKTVDGKEITLDLSMAVGINQKDEVIINDDNNQRLLIPNGIFGDTATAAMTINTAKQIDNIRKPGLLTMADIGLPKNTQHFRAKVSTD